MINYSQSFGMRARCMYCGSTPTYLSCIFSGSNARDPLDELARNRRYFHKKSVTETFNPVNYLFVPKKQTKLDYVSVDMGFNSVSVKTCKGLKTNSSLSRFSFKASFSCECFKTAWESRDLITLDKNHITERYSLKRYPLKIIVM